jgi:hypothetical protein
VYKLKNVRQRLKTSLEVFRCVLTGHDVSEKEENELFAGSDGYLETKCIRCHCPLLLRKDPADKEDNYYMLMER